MASLDNIQSGSFSNVNKGSFSNVDQGSLNKSNQLQAKSKVAFEGNPISNANENLRAISAGIYSLIGGILGYDKESRQALTDFTSLALQNPSQASKEVVNSLLSTYNLVLDDFGTMPIGEMVGHVLTGAWRHPIDVFLDFSALKGLIRAGEVTKKAKNLSTLNKTQLQKISDADVITKLAEEVTKDNLALHEVGNQFLNQLEAIEKRYSKNTIAKGMEAVETIGFKNPPSEYADVMRDLSKANDTYQTFVQMAGAELVDDVEFAARELVAKHYGVPFKQAEKVKGNSKTLEAMKKYVVDNDIRPLFHLEPKIQLFSNVELPKLKSDLFKRNYGTQDYFEAARDLAKKGYSTVYRIKAAKVKNSADALNEKIFKFNKITGRNIKKLDVENPQFVKILQELNNEFKKTMLGSGVYLGANVLTTTLSILNNFDLSAAIKTFKNLPRFRLVKLAEAETPILHKISQINNMINKPIASIDAYIEDIAKEYIKHYGVDKARFLQSTIPSLVVPVKPWEQIIKNIVPFANYPIAAMREVGAHVRYKPGKTLAYNQLNKLGQQANQYIQENIVDVSYDRTKAIRRDEEDNLVQKSTIVTPIQAANMFLFGTNGTAINIPILNFIEKLYRGVGDPSIFEVEGKTYKLDKGKITTTQGEFNLLPAILYTARHILTPVQVYNQVIVPMLSDKYISDETKLFNTMVNDAAYSNLSSQAQQKVTTKAREKLGKRVLGTYEYNYYDPDRFISKRIRRKVQRKQHLRNELRNLK